MALPISRNTTYVAGVSQVKSADLNDLQDKVIELYADGPHATRTRKVSWSAGAEDPEQGTVSECWNAGPAYVAASGGGSVRGWYMPIALEVGERLLAVRAWVRSDNDDLMWMDVFRSDGDGSTTQLGTTQETSTGAGAQDVMLEVSGLTEVVGSGPTAYVVGLTPTSATGDLRLYHIEIDYDRPPS